MQCTITTKWQESVGQPCRRFEKATSTFVYVYTALFGCGERGWPGIGGPLVTRRMILIGPCVQIGGPMKLCIATLAGIHTTYTNVVGRGCRDKLHLLVFKPVYEGKVRTYL